jgi:hypothetical protein
MPTTTKNWEEELINDFNALIKKFAPNWYPHLIDSDENAGEAFRQKIKQTLIRQAEMIRDEMLPDIKPFIKGIAYIYENNVNSGFNQCRTEIKKDLNKYINNLK